MAETALELEDEPHVGEAVPGRQRLDRGIALDIVELVMAMEEEFDIEIPDDDAEKIQTIGDAVTYVKDRLEA